MMANNRTALVVLAAACAGAASIYSMKRKSDKSQNVQSLFPSEQAANSQTGKLGPFGMS